MLYRILSNINSNFIVTTSIPSIINHTNLSISCATTWNSAFALLLATAHCFNFSKLPPTNVQYPDVDFMSLTEPTQSTSIHTLTFICSPPLKNKPLPGAPFRYLSTWYAASKCLSYGECINWQITLAPKEMIEIVWERLVFQLTFDIIPYLLEHN